MGNEMNSWLECWINGCVISSAHLGYILSTFSTGLLNMFGMFVSSTEKAPKRH